jgi:hypothetical protein
VLDGDRVYVTYGNEDHSAYMAAFPAADLLRAVGLRPLFLPSPSGGVGQRPPPGPNPWKLLDFCRFTGLRRR